MTRRNRTQPPSDRLSHEASKDAEQEPRVLAIGRDRRRTEAVDASRRGFFLRGLRAAGVGAAIAGGAAAGCGGGGGGGGRGTTRERVCFQYFHPAHSGGVTAVALSPDRAVVASAGGDGSVKLWDAATYTLRRTYSGHSSAVRSVAFSSDGARIVSQSAGSAQVWEVATGTKLAEYLGHTTGCVAVFKENDAWVASAGDSDGSFHVWNAVTGALVWKHVLQKDGDAAFQAICGLAWRQDSLAAVGSPKNDATGRVGVANLDSGGVYSTWYLEGVTGRYDSVAVSPDHSRVAAASPGGKLDVWAWTGSRLWRHDFGTSMGSRTRVAFSADGASVAAAVRAVAVFRAGTGEFVEGFNDVSGEATPAVAFDLSSHRIVMATVTAGLRMVDLASGATRGFFGDASLGEAGRGSACDDPSVPDLVGCTCDAVCHCDSVCGCESDSSVPCPCVSDMSPHYWFPT